MSSEAHNPGVETTLAGLFNELTKRDPQIGEAVTAYVAGDPGALMRLGPDAPRIIEAECVDPWGKGAKVLSPVAIDSKRLTPDQWVRLGQVYSLATSMVDAARQWPPAVPAWFMALQKRRQNSIGLVRAWQVGFLTDVLASGDVEPSQIPLVALTAFFNLIGDNHASEVRLSPRLVETHLVQDFVAFVQANIEDAKAALADTSAADRVMTMTWLEQLPAVTPALAPILAQWSVSSAKSVRDAALRMIAGLPEPSQAVAAALDLGTPANLEPVIEFASRLPGGADLLRDAMGRGGRRDQLLQAALDRQQVILAPPPTSEVPPVPPLDTAPLGEEFTDRLQAAVAQHLANLERSVAAHPDWEWLKTDLQVTHRMDRAFCESARDWLNGDGPRPKEFARVPRVVLQGLDLPLVAAARAVTEQRGRSLELNAWSVRYILGADFDLRSLAQAGEHIGVGDAVAAVADSVFWDGLDGRRPENIWPFFAAHPQRLDEALGLAPKLKRRRPDIDEMPIALRILGMFPALPTQYIPTLAQYAMSPGKKHRRIAQALLLRQPDLVVPFAVGALSDGRNEMRAAAAELLARIGDPAAVPALRAALAKEKREQPQAAMLSALRLLGDDISAHLAPAVLLAAAKKGLAAKPPAGMSWFPLDALPPVCWADGTPVDADLVRWWAVLAVKLKDPLGVGLIPLYVELLDEASRRALGSFVLDAWIAGDTRTVSDDQARAYAAGRVDELYEQYQEDFERYGQYSDFWTAHASMTKDQIFEQLIRDKVKEYAGSTIGEKGLLALTVGAPGHHVYEAVQRYIRDHGHRRAQIEALITAASGNPDPSAIQLVLSVARKFRQETVRLRAAELADDIAMRAGWSIDELADRTIPTAGFDESGVLVLDFGPRQFTGRIARSPKTGAFTINLFNPDGKPITALPQPGASDDEEAANESRKQLTTSKKELTQVAALQSSRLFEAMCVERTWDGASWREYMLGHPVMAHLISTLVWQTWDASGRRLFRPTVDGELLDCQDNPVHVADDARVGLAHAATITPEEAVAWRKNLADFAVIPLFNQFDATVPEFAPDATEIDDHKGWLSDTFAIRGRATKRGYRHGDVEDGGWYDYYVKPLPSSDIKVIILFTGSVVPEEQMPAAITELIFLRDGDRFPLGSAPKILLAESYADYVYIAEAGAFDKDWESKSSL